MKATRISAAALGALMLLTSSGCGSADAAPLEVTYYYLPG